MEDNLERIETVEYNQKKNQFDITEILAIVWRRKWLIVIPLILVSIVTFAGSYLITPEYEASTIILVGNPVKLSTELQRLLGDARPGYRSSRDRQMELKSLQNEITSSPFIYQLVQRLKLDESPSLHAAALKQQRTAPELTLDQIKFDILLNSLRENITVGFAGNNQIKISVSSTDPFRARDITESLGEVFIAEKMKQERGVIRASDEFTYGQLSKYEKDLEDRVNEKTEFEREFNKIKLDDIVASDENQIAIESEISSARIEIEDLKRDERRLIGELSDIAAKNLKITESETLKSINRDIDNHLSSVADLVLKYTWSDPEILNHKSRLFNLISDIHDENVILVDRQFSSYEENTRERLVELFNVRAELDVLYSRVNSLRLALADLEGKVDLIPEYQARLDQLSREVDNARELRDKFKDQQESSQISQALLRESKYIVIEPAKVPLEPFTPKRARIVILGFLLGLALGGSAALLVEILDKSFRKIEDVEAALGFPVIGVIPMIDPVRKMKLKK